MHVPYQLFHWQASLNQRMHIHTVEIPYDCCAETVCEHCFAPLTVVYDFKPCSSLWSFWVMSS
jgi:hypothetical protein